MKYMGSKRSMLKNGLGELIRDRAQSARRVVDLFCGAGSVAWFAAEQTAHPVLAVDLQAYAAVLAQAVVARDIPLDAASLEKTWLEEARRSRRNSICWSAAVAVEANATDVRRFVSEARMLCAHVSGGGVWSAYGGYYFSPLQALTFDAMLAALPTTEPARSVCLAATIAAASKCAAAPGHTAQPFQPTETASRFLMEAWIRDPLAIGALALRDLCPRHAHSVGEARVSDAFDAISQLGADDLVIVDPPYSSVHYSRFYHVLETIARGHAGDVSGVGRYPPIEERPQSRFSVRSQSRRALEDLLASLAAIGATVIFTFPAGECSNGLSGAIVSETARRWFDVTETAVNGRFSTLGGNNAHRAARTSACELILLMQPTSKPVNLHVTVTSPAHDVSSHDKSLL